MIAVGDFVFDTIEKANVQVLEKIEAWGYTSYKVFNPATGRVYKANEEQLSSSGSTMQYDENYLRYVTLLSKIKNETAGGFLSSLASGIIPLPHQLHVLNRAMETNNIRYILADEVGLGKTIEAGMIIRELKSRGLVSRVSGQSFGKPSHAIACCFGLFRNSGTAWPCFRGLASVCPACSFWDGCQSAQHFRQYAGSWCGATLPAQHYGLLSRVVESGRLFWWSCRRLQKMSPKQKWIPGYC